MRAIKQASTLGDCCGLTKVSRFQCCSQIVRKGEAVCDPELTIKPMPPSAVISNFVEGIPDCNYEIYLRELINNSTYFRDKGKSAYSEPPSEEAGQCDAISEEYELDFKLLDSQTMLMADGILRKRPMVLAPGTVACAECKKPSGEVEVTKLRVALRGLSVDDLVNIRRNKTNRTNTQNDIPQILEVVEVKKHILMLFPYVFSFGQELHSQDPIETIRAAMNEDFRNLFLYREKTSPGFDTYLATVFSDSFLVFKIIHGEFYLVESISTKHTPTYKQLLNYGDIWS